MEWTIEKVINYLPEKLWGFGHSQFGFYDRKGNLIAIDHDNNRLGQLDSDGESFVWSAGIQPFPKSQVHINCAIKGPVYAGDPGDGSYLVSSYANNIIYRITPARLQADILIDGDRRSLADMHNCEPDGLGNIWTNAVTAKVVRCFNAEGKLLFTLGDGHPGFQAGTISWENVRFNNIYDLRRGPDGNIYILDSGNYSVRKIDIMSKTVTTIAGTGKPGYSGDQGPAVQATLGGNSKVDFDGPWSLSLDGMGNIFIGDTQNGVIRMIDHKSGLISTIAGNGNPVPGLRNSPEETNPMEINLPLICSLDYHNNRLFIPEWEGDLVILKANKAGPSNREE